MTVSMLYALYRSAYREAAHASVGEEVPAPDLAVVASGLTPLERAIVELALHDLSGGTPMRSRIGFDAAVEQGAPLLVGLGLDAGEARLAERPLARTG